MKTPRHSSYPMSAEDREELAREFEEFGYRETDDPDDADRRNYYKVERWDSTGQRVFELLHASNDLGRAQTIFALAFGLRAKAPLRVNRNSLREARRRRPR
jgi:hypothetical protein